MNHRTVSFIKSAIRIASLFWLWAFMPIGIIGLMVAEVFGVIEELYEKEN